MTTGSTDNWFAAFNMHHSVNFNTLHHIVESVLFSELPTIRNARVHRHI